MTHAETLALVESRGACADAKKWVTAHPRWDSAKLWQACPRGDWLLWIAGRMGVKREALVMATCACARLALRYVKPGENRPLEAIETTESWAMGEATIDQVIAADASYAYAYAADAADAADAAAYAAYAYAYAADAADAAAYAAYAAYAADAPYTRSRMQKDCAKAVRQLISAEMVLDAINGARDEGKGEGNR